MGEHKPYGGTECFLVDGVSNEPDWRSLVRPEALRDAAIWTAWVLSGPNPSFAGAFHGLSQIEAQYKQPAS